MRSSKNKQKGLSPAWAVVIAAVITSIVAPIILWWLGVSSNKDTGERRSVVANIVAGAQKLAATVNPNPKNTSVPIKSGHLKYSFSEAQIAPVTGSRPNAEIRATIKIGIMNAASVPVRVAFAMPWPTLQIDGGLTFQFVDERGIQQHGYPPDIRTCSAAVQNFTSLPPGDPPQNVILTFRSDLSGRQLKAARSAWIAGQLLVQSTETNECWLEPIPTENVPVSVTTD